MVFNIKHIAYCISSVDYCPHESVVLFKPLAAMVLRVVFHGSRKCGESENMFKTFLEHVTPSSM